MNSSYTNRLSAFWNTNPTELQYSPLMHGIPTTTNPVNLTANNEHHSLSLFTFRPYNHYPITCAAPSSLSPTIDGNGVQIGGPHKSAFKPVKRKISNASSETNTYAEKPNYFDTSNIALTSGSIYNPSDSIQMSIPQNPPVYTDAVRNTSLKCTKDIQNINMPLENVEKSSDLPVQKPRQQSNLEKLLRKPVNGYEKSPLHVRKNNSANSSPVENVLQWDSLLPLVRRPQKRIGEWRPRRKITNNTHTHKRRQQSSVLQNASVCESDVPIIDLTLSDDFDECIPTSVIELNQKPPLDINGNEILISTNTETMQAVPYKKAYDKNADTAVKRQPNQMPLSCDSINNQKIADTSNDSSSSKERLDSPILFTNLMRGSRHKPTKEQIEHYTKNNGSVAYLRRYNGFRLFVERNYSRAQSHAPRNQFTKTFVRNTLLRWWSTMSTAKKEKYAEIAEYIQTKKAFDLRQSNDDNERNISIASIFGDCDNSTSKASDVNVSGISEAGATTSSVNTINTHLPVNDAQQTMLL